MTRTAPRLYVTAPLAAGQTVPLSAEQGHYLRHVMRLETGSEVILFNGQDGEWTASLEEVRKAGATALPTRPTRAQHNVPDLWLLFAPIKSARIDMIAEKAGELGVAQLYPVLTQHTQAARVNIERLQAHAIEAAEQCERLDIPHVHAAIKLEQLMANWPAQRTLLVCAERREAADMPAILKQLPSGPMAILVGPEGGFADDELNRLERLPFVKFMTLGPRILRAETACFAALSLWQALQGDWKRA